MPAAAVELLERRSLLMSIAFPTDLEQYVVEVINYERRPGRRGRPVRRRPERGAPARHISATPKQPLAINPTLTASATAHTQSMLQTQTFSHRRQRQRPLRPRGGGRVPVHRVLGLGREHRLPFPVGTPPPVPTEDQENQDRFVDSTVPDRGHRLNS